MIEVNFILEVNGMLAFNYQSSYLNWSNNKLWAFVDFVKFSFWVQQRVFYSVRRTYHFITKFYCANIFVLLVKIEKLCFNYFLQFSAEVFKLDFSITNFCFLHDSFIRLSWNSHGIPIFIIRLNGKEYWH